jgi:hypothetical protein
MLLVLILAVGLIFPSTWSYGEAIIPIEMKHDVTLVTLRIGDTTIPRILLDTGMPFDGVMIYNPDYRDSLDLSRAMEVRVGGAGSGDPATALMLDSASFFLGDIEMSNQRVLMLQNDIYKGFPTNGIIGYSIFGHYATELNYDEGTMSLYGPDELEIGEGWTAVPMYFKDNTIPWIDASVVIEDEEPVSLSMYIDFASRDAVELLERPEMKFRLPEDTEEAHLGTGLSGEIHGKRGRIARLIIGPYALTNVDAAIAPAEIRSKQDNADAVLGNGSLRRFNLIFDYAGGHLYIRPNSHFDEPF